MRILSWVLTSFLLPAGCQASVEQQLRAQLEGKGIAAPRAIILSLPITNVKQNELVIGTARRRENEIWLRIRCRLSAECKPFFARLQYQTASEAESATRRFAEVGVVKNTPILVRAGSRVRLSIKSRHLVFSVEAIALQNGRKGEIIRARADGNIRYASVKSSTELEESL